MSDLGTRRTPYSIPDGTSPFPEDRVTWALEQAPHLGWTEYGVLIFLARHAWGGNGDDEPGYEGFVYPKWSSERKIAAQMGKSQKVIHDALTRLRGHGYITVSRDLSRGPGAPSQIKIWWYEKADIMREQVRANERELPDLFRSVERIAPAF